MKTTVTNGWDMTGWIFGAIILAIGITNVFLVHPVPGIVCILLSLLYLPSAHAIIGGSINRGTFMVLKLIIGILIIWFTLGVSDLGDMFDKWLQ